VFPQLAVDDTNPSALYLAYMNRSGNPAHADILAVRSTDRGRSWEAPIRVNDDTTMKHQFFPTVATSGGVLHVAWFDLRDSPNPTEPTATNDVLHVYYASANTSAGAYPSFSQNVRVSDVGQQPNCRFGFVGFMGDYLEITAFDAGDRHVVDLAWPDNRDIPAAKCDLDPAPGPSPISLPGSSTRTCTPTV
jgi:hypothetical protein